MENQPPKKDLRTQVMIVESTSVFSGNPTQTHVMAYRPSLDQNGNFDVDGNGVVIKLEKVGGVKIGALGRMMNRTIRVSKSQLHGYEKVPSLGLDTAELVLVDLTEYKQMAWFLTSQAKVIS